MLTTLTGVHKTAQRFLEQLVATSEHVDRVRLRHRCPLSYKFRPLRPQEQTFLVVPPKVRS